VVQDKSGDKEGFNDIEDLQNRFKSLKNENKQLMARVSVGNHILLLKAKSLTSFIHLAIEATNKQRDGGSKSQREEQAQRVEEYPV